MSKYDLDFLSDSTEQTSTRFVCFIGQSMHRFDLAITTTGNFYGKILVTELKNGKTIILGPDDLDAEGYLEHAFDLAEDAAEDLHIFLEQVVGTVHFSEY